MTTKEFAKWFSNIEGLNISSIEEDKVYFTIIYKRLKVFVYQIVANLILYTNNHQYSYV